MALAVPAASFFAAGCAPQGPEDTDDAEPSGEAASALGQGFLIEVEPNGAPATATPITGDSVAYGNIFLGSDQDYFSFTGAAGDRVFVATGTSNAQGSSSSTLDLFAPDGTTVIENDVANGSLGTTSSTIAGAVLTQTGTHYIRVIQAGTSTLRPYHLHFKTQSGMPAPEVEPNDMAPQPLPASGWVAGAISPATDVDVYSFTLNAGDTLFASLDLDPERDGTEFNGTLAMGPFAGTLLSVNDGGATGPDSEAFFATVKYAGTYAVAVASSAAGSSGTYQLSASVHPATSAPSCTTYTSMDGVVTIPTGPAIVSSTITVPGNPRVADINVDLDINHAAPPDLDVTLVSPQGSEIGLFTDIGASTYPDLDIALDDEAAFSIGSSTLATGLTMMPEATFQLRWFEGQDAGGTWTLNVRDDLASNGGTINGWSITVCEPPPEPACGNGAPKTVPLMTDFEADNGGFTHSGTLDAWAHGTPAQAPNFTNCHSGTSCFKTGLTGNYSSNSNQNLVSPPIDLTNQVAPITASWAAKYQLESASFDPFWVEVREVGGANAKHIWEHTGATMSTSVGSPSVTIQEVAQWGLYSADISAYAGKMVELVFHLQTDGSVTYPGVVIDDVKVSACPGAVCGDGAVEGSEACDDGDLTDGDGCDSNCTLTACGNTIVTMGEACDDGNLTDGDGCDSNCTATACGNGVVTMGEVCDDGNGMLGDGCDDGMLGNCTVTACGNSVVTMGEVCDDGNATDGDGCDSNCTVTGCGNGVVTMGEMCDDGNGMLGDGCDDGALGNCTPSACGNGVQAGGEGCDDGNLTDGDGCDANCTVTGCGNGVITMGEDCDDGNDVSGDGCDNNCTATACGNGVQTDGEACDDGNLDEGDGCDTNCTPSACGNGIQAGNEACDDGNATDGDGCDSNCTATGCGNGVVTMGEACDDGNATDGDGCDSNCTASGCGNGVQDPSEECDDGNPDEGDGCDTNCTASGCGNGVQDSTEACDDGNTKDGDGCDSKCMTEGQGGAGGGGAGGSSAGGGGAGGGGAGGSGGAGGGGEQVEPGGGCGCRVAGDESSGSPLAPAFALLGLGMFLRRRRRG